MIPHSKVQASKCKTLDLGLIGLGLLSFLCSRITGMSQLTKTTMNFILFEMKFLCVTLASLELAT